MKRYALCLVLAFSITAAGTAIAATQPKPWQWKPPKAATKLVAAQPIAFDSYRLSSATCVGKSKGIAGRYSRFLCQVSYSTFTSPLLIRVLPVGTGKLCVVTAADGRSLPRDAKTPVGLLVVPARVCP